MSLYFCIYLQSGSIMVRSYMRGDFWSKVKKHEDGCWIWLAGKTGGKFGGYGLTTRDGKRVCAHQFAYEEKHGPVPDGFELDHLCRNHACVNPTHLELVTHKENILRGTSPAALKARQTHCRKGHLLDEKNTYVYSNGNRQCRTCHNEYQSNLRRQRK